MKKIITIALAGMIGAVAQSAQVTWSANAIQNSPDNSVTAGWIVQIFDSSVSYDYEKAAAGEITPWVSGSTVAAGTTYRATGTTDLANGTSKTIYAVIYDASSIAAAKNYIVSDNLTITASEGGAKVTAGFGSMTGTTAAANKFLNSSWTSTSAVPEPTTVALLALGLAAVGLKRKVA